MSIRSTSFSKHKFFSKRRNSSQMHPLHDNTTHVALIFFIFAFAAALTTVEKSNNIPRSEHDIIMPQCGNTAVSQCFSVRKRRTFFLWIVFVIFAAGVVVKQAIQKLL